MSKRTSSLQRHVKRPTTLLGVVLVTIAIGVGLMLASSAQTSTSSLELENGTLAGGVNKVNDTSASGGSAIKYGSIASAPSGEAMPVGDITGWTQIYTQDFKTDAAVGSMNCASQGCRLYGGTLSAYPNGWHDTSANGQYNAGKTLSVSGGLLDIHVFTDAAGVHYVAAPELTLPASYDRTSARIAIRFKSTSTPGYKTAWLLWPDSNTWPRDGEIDFPEGDLNSTIGGFMHRQDATAGSDQDAYPNVSFSGNRSYTTWHTAVLEWVAGTSLKVYLDGVLFGQSTSRVPNTPMHYVIQTETQLSGGAPSNSADGHVSIDWVAVWKKAP